MKKANMLETFWQSTRKSTKKTCRRTVSVQGLTSNRKTMRNRQMSRDVQKMARNTGDQVVRNVPVELTLTLS